MPQAIAVAIGSLLFGAGASLAVVNFVAIGFGSTLISAALGIGISLAAGALLRPNIPIAPRLKPSDGQQVIRQAVPQRWKHYGKVRIAGLIFWWQTEDTEGELYMGLVLNQGRIDAFEDYQIDDSTVEIDGSGNVITAPYSGITTKILTRLGVDPETAYSEIQSAFGYGNVRGDGVATVLGIFDNFATAEDQQENYPNGFPRLRVTIRASVVWDMRDDTQDREDETTWQWSENPVICLLDYMLSADGFGLSWDRIAGNIDEWEQAADICEEQVWSVEDTQFEDRYRIAASYLFTEKPSDVVQRFVETFDGRIWQRRDGTIGITAGADIAVNIELGDDAIRLFKMERGEDRLTAVAGIRAQYMSPGNDYREADAEPWPDGETVLALDDERTINLELTWVPSHGQARRLMEREYVRANAKWRGQIVTGLAGLRAFDERYARITISELGIDEVFEIGHYSLDLTRMEVAIDVISATAIVDPARSAVAQTGLFYRGSGHIESVASSPGMNYFTVDDGAAPQVGDVAVWAIRGSTSPLYSLPAGWTEILHTPFVFANVEQVLLWKVLTQADLDTPAQPFTNVETTLLMWTAFSPPDSGTATQDLFDVEETTNNPNPVTADATGITAPHILISSHNSDSLVELTSPNWSGDTPDFTQSEQMDAQVLNHSLVFKHKVYLTGPGSNVQADMNDEGSTNSQMIFIIKFV